MSNFVKVTYRGRVRPMAAIEKDIYITAIKNFKGTHITELVRQLGIGRSTFYVKIDELQLRPYLHRLTDVSGT